MSKLSTFVLAALAGGLLTAPSAGAASKETERLALQVSGLQGQVTDLQKQVEDLQRELRRLNESLAEQNANTKRAQQEQLAREESILALLREMQEKLAEVSAFTQRPAPAAALPVEPAPAGGMPPAGAVPGPGPAGAPAPPPGTLPANAPAPRELYSQAYADFARGNYDLAIQGFQEYLRLYPATDFSDNAQYWIGECLYGKQRFQEAIDAWKVLYRDYPSSDKLPDAHVKSGMAFEKLGRRSQALVEFRFVVDRYPNTQAARIARDRLNPN